jgi:hypothetical protein
VTLHQAVSSRVGPIESGLSKPQLHLELGCDQVLPHLLSLLDSVRDAVVGRSLLSERELTDLSDALRTHLQDPDTIVVRQFLFQD